MKTITTFGDEGTLFAVSRNLESILLRSNLIVKGQVRVRTDARTQFHNLDELVSKLKDLATSNVDADVAFLYEVFETFIEANPNEALKAFRLSNKLTMLIKDLQLNENLVYDLSSDLRNITNSFN